ncbi:MAG: L,D-transpeptidase [Oscillospiraceae bacterium]|nr:L,D-transpeptidase [Oscillospiraceae bacterium]
MDNTENTEKKKNGLRKFVWILPLIGLVVLALAVFTVSRRYTRQFLPGTEILGVDCGNRTVSQAVAELENAAEAAHFVVGDSSGVEVFRSPLSAFIGRDVLAAAAEDAFRDQRASARWYDWMMEAPRAYFSEPLADLTDAQVGAVLTELRFGEAGAVPPRDAYVEITDTGYTVVEAVPGNMFNVYVCARELGKVLRPVRDLTAGVPTVIIDGVAVRPSVTADSEEIQEVTLELDSYLNRRLTVNFDNGNSYTFTSADIRAVSDVSVLGRMVVCRPDTVLLRSFLDTEIEDYGTDGVFAKFQHANETRPYVYYRVGDRGWIMDREGLAAEIASALNERRNGLFTPNYDRTWYWKDYYRGHRVGDTFIEISLDNQYMWCYKNGQVLVETPIVTGNLARRDDTRRGCFRIYGKVRDTVLRGPTWNDHVEYWMPFDGGIGLHDSSWRDEYGEDIYMDDGSHGCINTPLEAMKTIYENYSKGDFVIVY